MNDLLGSAWLQLAAWMLAGGAMLSVARLMRGAHLIWGLVAAGVMLVGLRVGYKLLPFAAANEALAAGRYVVGIAGVIVLFIGIQRYCNIALRPLYARR